MSHVENHFNQWNDTLVVLSVDSKGRKQVKLYEGTTDPGVARAGIATIPEGTHTMEFGYHAPSSGNYDALNPRHDGHTPVIRDGKSRLGGNYGGGQWLNIHTTHGYNRGALPGPGAYSEGCSVINGADQYRSFIASMRDASKNKGQENIYYTVVSAARLEELSTRDE